MRGLCLTQSRHTTPVQQIHDLGLWKVHCKCVLREGAGEVQGVAFLAPT